MLYLYVVWSISRNTLSINSILLAFNVSFVEINKYILALSNIDDDINLDMIYFPIVSKYNFKD